MADLNNLFRPKGIAIIGASNRPFTIADETSEAKGEAGEVFEFRVKYIDPDDDKPTTAKLVYELDTETRSVELVEEDPSDEDFTDGKEYYAKVKLDRAGRYGYWFEFANARNPLQTTEVRDVEVEEASGFVPGMGLLAASGSLALAWATSRRLRRRG